MTSSAWWTTGRPQPHGRDPRRGRMERPERRPPPQPLFNWTSNKLQLCTSGPERWLVMLAELIQEARLGRVIGPAKAPSWWPVQTSPIPNPGLRRYVLNGKVKIRRGEDWRRSAHNATIRAWDIPTHHMVGHGQKDGGRPGQHPCLRTRPPERLPAVAGAPPVPQRHVPTHRTWVDAVFHLAMCFGATASVWNFNRVADALQLLTHILFLLVGGHYVDDFNGVEYAEHALGQRLPRLFRVLPRLGSGTQPHPTTSGQTTPRHSPGVEIQFLTPPKLDDSRASSRSLLRLCLAQWDAPPYNQCTPGHITPRRATTSAQDFAPPSMPWLTS